MRTIDEVCLGDKVIVIKEDCEFVPREYSVGDILTVTGPLDWSWFEGNLVDIGAFTSSIFSEDFKKCFAVVQDVEPTVVNITNVSTFPDGLADHIKKLIDNSRVTPQRTSITPLGVARPDLETRKVGKNRVELVDKGFPNALWEIARLMTKAQEVKQYKDHDWKNLSPDVFSSAGSRHRMKHNMGELYDNEFEGEGFLILHKVNEAFNVLAELELMLTTEKD